MKPAYAPLKSFCFFATIGTDKYSDDRTDDHHYNKNSADSKCRLEMAEKRGRNEQRNQRH